MAIYRFEAKVISRSGGRGAVASAAYRTGKCATSSAAYRAGEKLTDERTGETYDYTKKGGVAGAEIMTPEGAPEWMQDRGKLWNGVEKVEKRKDAQLARDFIISLPHELTPAQRMELTRDFVREQFAARGYVADIAWHSPDRGESLNHHAHVMVPMRKVEGDRFAAHKERPPEGQHPAAAWKEELARLREAWANTANKHLEAAGLDIRIDHRSLEARGLDREPEPKQGPLATQIERDGRASLAGNERRAVKARNAERDQARTELASVTKEAAALAPQPSARPLSEIEIRHALADNEAKLAREAQGLRAERAAAEFKAGWARDMQGGPNADAPKPARPSPRDAAQQEAWRAKVEKQTPDTAKPVEKGLQVVDSATGAVSKLADFMTDLLAGGSSSPAPDKPADMKAFVSDPAARKEQQLARIAAQDQATAAEKALDRIADDMKAGKALSSSDIKSLTPEHQMQIKHFGDNAVRQMVDDAQKRAEQHWKSDGRERE